MDQQVTTDIDTAIGLARGHSWIPLALLIVNAVVRIMKDDRAVAWCRLEIAPRYRAWAALVFGLVLGVLHKLSFGGTWGEAIVGGVVAGGGSTLLHELVIESIRRGRDVGIPKPVVPPPPGPPPLSIKPPPGIVITDSSKPPGSFLVAHRIVWLACLLLLAHCTPAATSVALQQGELVANAGDCRNKMLATIARGGACELKRARLAELVKYDADCVGLYGDAGPTFLCHDVNFNEGGTE